jgi:hypothetical protein
MFHFYRYHLPLVQRRRMPFGDYLFDSYQPFFTAKTVILPSTTRGRFLKKLPPGPPQKLLIIYLKRILA